MTVTIDHRPAPVLVCYGTRPEVIKLAPVVAALHAHERLRPIGVTTAQHRDMLDQALAAFDMVPDIDLGLMRPGQSIDSLASLAIGMLGPVLRRERPSAVVVQGDTTTALCAALAGFWLRIPVAHVEAGLRTWDRSAPFPEEANRQMIASLADLHFCPTEVAAANLRSEGVAPSTIHVTGNTVVDALHMVLAAGGTQAAMPAPSTRARRLLVTMHRRESQGSAQRAILRRIVRVASERDVEVVLPVHPNPSVRAVVEREASGRDGIRLVDPVGYADFVELMRTSDLILTDSGGMQEEAPVLGVPLLVMRDTTERPEGIDAGCVELVGTDPAHVEARLLRLLEDDVALAAMAAAPQPYGDGTAATRIADALARLLDGDRRERTRHSLVAATAGGPHPTTSNVLAATGDRP